MTVAGILLTIPLVSSASSTGERLETRNAVIIVLALLELVHLQIKQIAHGKTAGNVKFIIIWRMIAWKKRKQKSFISFWIAQIVNATMKRPQLFDGRYSN